MLFEHLKRRQMKLTGRVRRIPATQADNGSRAVKLTCKACELYVLAAP